MSNQWEKNLDETHKFYEAYAQPFSASRKHMQWDAFRIFKPFVKGDVLDVGCGSGRFLQYCPVDPKHYLGVDSSASMIGFAKKTFTQHTFVVSEILSFVPSQTYDSIVCVAMLHHITDPATQKKLIRLFHSWLKPQGTLCLTNWIVEKTHTDKQSIQENIFRIQTESGHSRYYYMFTQQEIDTLLNENEFFVEISCVSDTNFVHVARKK